MSDGLSVSGGAGGMGATLADLRTEAHIMRDAGGDLVGRASKVAKMAVHDDVLAAALICPDLVPGVEAAIGSAAAGPGGLAVRGADLAITGTLVDASAFTYEAVDQAQAYALDKLQTVAGIGAGVALPGALVVGGTGLAAYLATHPAVAAALAEYARTGQMTTDLQRTLYENPWLLEALTRSAPGLLQGASFTLAGLVPGGPPLISLLTGGKWPTTNYEDAVAGLIGLGNLGGAFEDSGNFRIADPGNPQDSVTSYSVDWHQTAAVHDIFQLQGNMDGRDFVPGGGDQSKTGQLMIVKVPQPDGSAAYVVQIPGTEEWSPTRGTNPVDLTTNVQLMTQRDAQMRQLVAQAIEQNVPPGSPVMLTGHSQGGITAASIASDPALVHQLNIKSVVTGGSPIGRFDIDPSVSVLSVEHTQDPVPMLDGTANPDRANWTTVRRDLPQANATSEAGVLSPGNAHLTTNYVRTGETIDASNDPSLEAWRQQNAQFFSSTGTATATRYSIIPTP
jgi:hypothetical protein